jgi:hypothetical protein
MNAINILPSTNTIGVKNLNLQRLDGCLFGLDGRSFENIYKLFFYVFVIDVVPVIIF